MSLVLNIVSLVSPVCIVLNSLLRRSLPGGRARIVVDVINPAPIVKATFPPVEVRNIGLGWEPGLPL